MVTGNNVRTTDKTTGHNWRIKMNALSAYSRRQHSLGSFANRWGIDCVNVIEKWAKGLHTFQKIFAGAYRRIKTHANVVIKQKVHTKIVISSATDCLRVSGAGWSNNGRNSSAHIKLLRMSGNAR